MMRQRNLARGWYRAATYETCTGDRVMWIAERRREHHGAGRARLVVVVDDLRVPRPIHDPVHVLGLGLERRIEIAVVVVPDVLLV